MTNLILLHGTKCRQRTNLLLKNKLTPNLPKGKTSRDSQALPNPNVGGANQIDAITKQGKTPVNLALKENWILVLNTLPTTLCKWAFPKDVLHCLGAMENTERPLESPLISNRAIVGSIGKRKSMQRPSTCRKAEHTRHCVICTPTYLFDKSIPFSHWEMVLEDAANATKNKDLGIILFQGLTKTPPQSLQNSLAIAMFILNTFSWGNEPYQLHEWWSIRGKQTILMS